MTTEREKLREEFETFLREKGVSDDELWEAILDTGKDRIWRAGFKTRARWWLNVVGMFGVLIGAATAALAFFGYELVRR